MAAAHLPGHAKGGGNVAFHTAMCTAFPRATPAPDHKPGPIKVEDARLKSVLGITDVQSVMKGHSLAVVGEMAG